LKEPHGVISRKTAFFLNRPIHTYEAKNVLAIDTAYYRVIKFFSIFGYLDIDKLATISGGRN
jgi:hypothetical protein